MEEKKKRGPNWTDQENLLLAELMGEANACLPHMSNHVYLKSRFGFGITAKSKKELLGTLSQRLNASCNVERGVDDIDKKWHNLVQKHRCIYSDYRRTLQLTGGGPASKQPSIITEAVLSVIGKDSISITGITGGIDTSMLGLLPQEDTLELENGSPSSINPLDGIGFVSPQRSANVSSYFRRPAISTPTISTASTCPTCESLQSAILKLKKRKIELQIKYFEKKLKEE